MDETGTGDGSTRQRQSTVDVVLRVTPWKLTLVLALIWLAIAGIDLTLQYIENDARGKLDYLVYWGFAQPEPGEERMDWRFEEARLRFDIDREQNIPTWYSSSLFLACAGTLVAVALRAKDKGERFTRLWLLLAGVVVLASLDDVAMIHEMTTGADRPGGWLNRLLGWTNFVYFDWVLLGGILAASVGLIALPLIVQLPRRARWTLLVAAAVFLGGSLGIETIAGNVAREEGYFTMRFHLWSVLEETMEALGLIAAIFALLQYLRTLEARGSGR